MNTKKKYGIHPYTGLDESDEPDYQINAVLFEPPSAVPAVVGTTAYDFSTLSGGNIIVLGPGNDQYNAGPDNDTIQGSGGNDTINGGGGVDTLVYTGNFSNYTINYNSTTSVFTITDNVSGRDGIDVVSETEFFQFADVIKTANELQDGGGSGGTAGIVITDFGREDYGYSMALQADGKIIVAGTAHNGTDYDFALARYTSTGMLDTTFHGDGKLNEGAAVNEDIMSVVVQNDGKIVVAGETNGKFALSRYTADGSIDFLKSYDFGAPSFATSVILQADGKIVVAGTAMIDGDNDFAVIRYTSNGLLDTSFSVNGVATAHFGGDDYAQAVIQQADGKIVVTGTAMVGSTGNFALVRYNSNGTLDTTFQEVGKTDIDLIGKDDYAFNLIQQADGRLVVAGTTYNGSNWDFSLVRLNSNGALDNTFNGNGGKLLGFSAGKDDVAYDVIQQANSKLVVAGKTYNGSNWDFALARLNSNGSLDTTFGPNGSGYVITDIGYDDEGRSLSIQADGKILLAGTSNNNFALLRYTQDGLLDTSFGSGSPGDTTPPTITGRNPADGATNVAVGSNIVLTFSEAIQRGTGTIAIRKDSATGTIIESYDAATSNNLQVSGTTLTINPTADLVAGTHYFVTFASGTIKDTAGNSFVGTTEYDFTTETLMLGGTAESWIYLASYPDLMAAFGTDTYAAAAHYNTYGKNEGRAITFDAWGYLASYNDLRGAFGTDLGTAAKHYVEYGASEGREITFDAWGYLASYNDLRGAFGTDTAAATRHYVEYGANEDRSITFDAWGYLASYNDLRGAFGTDTAAATKHYIEYGANEGRTITFDAEAYLAAYPDLQAAFGTDTAAATRHYVEYGANEGRTIPATAAASGIETLSAVETATELPLEIIRDFVTGEDQIDLSGIDANTDLDGNQPFSGPLLAESDPFTQAGQLRYDDTEGILYGNTDSDLEPEFTIELIGAPALELADLILSP